WGRFFHFVTRRARALATRAVEARGRQSFKRTLASPHRRIAAYPLSRGTRRRPSETGRSPSLKVRGARPPAWRARQQMAGSAARAWRRPSARRRPVSGPDRRAAAAFYEASTGRGPRLGSGSRGRRVGAGAWVPA